MPDQSPSRTVLARAAEIAGPSATVTAVRALAGGTHANTYLVQTANPDREIVLREFPAGDDAAEREAHVLGALDGLNGLAPRLLAGAGNGTSSERPCVLISRLPGQPNITPDDPRGWAAELGLALVRIHATRLPRVSGFENVFTRPGGALTTVTGPAAALVEQGAERLRGAPTVLTHYDFWSGNTLWQRDRLSGVVDWSGAALGPRGFDLGWCRLDLYLLFDGHIADVFLSAYERAIGFAVPDRLVWDLWAVARSRSAVEEWAENYRGLGRPDLTASVLRQRHTAWTECLLNPIEGARMPADTAG
jgi:aminoglycoside phosphotransferase (APT) family kinase protein